jgi:predicted adenine nucleotide alpha hydrolase (AANH) superfamily ATPase
MRSRRSFSVLYPKTRYLYSDFKKEDGQLKGILLAKKYALYGRTTAGVFRRSKSGKPMKRRRKVSRRTPLRS